MKVDEDHSNFEASPSEQEVWWRSTVEQRALEAKLPTMQPKR